MQFLGMVVSNVLFRFSSPEIGEMIQFDLRIFFRWVETTIK